MSFIARRSTAVLARSNQLRFYAANPSKADKDRMNDSAGDTLKQAGQAFKSDGAIGKEFTAEGSVGGTAQAVGGPFDKDGAIGKQFTQSGSVGGTAQQTGESAEQQGKDTKP